MPTLTLKPTHKPIKYYYAALDRFANLGVAHETAVRAAFQDLLQHCARQAGWTLVPEHAINPRRGRRIIIDGFMARSVEEIPPTAPQAFAEDVHENAGCEK